MRNESVINPFMFLSSCQLSSPQYKDATHPLYSRSRWHHCRMLLAVARCLSGAHHADATRITLESVSHGMEDINVRCPQLTRALAITPWMQPPTLPPSTLLESPAIRLEAPYKAIWRLTSTWMASAMSSSGFLLRSIASL